MKTVIIIRFSYESLRNETHVEFHTTFNSLFTRYSVGTLGITVLYNVYKPLFDEEVAALDQILKSALTPLIEDQEQKRDQVLRGFCDAVKSALNHYDTTRRNAAQKVEVILEHYGNIAAKPYDEETAAIDDLCRELQKQGNIEQVNTLGLGEWLSQLSQANRAFDALMMQRYTELSKRPDLHMRDIRKQVDGAFRAILDLLESLVRVNGPNTNKAFLDELNAIMKRYRDILAQETGRRHHRKDLGEGDHTVVEPIETQTWTGRAITVIPRAWYREEGQPTVELTFAVDFTVTYKNNVNAGTAEVTLHGIGRYKGTVTVTFNIARV
jgi:uncharacterized protein YicC (UPF0701 family)